MGIPVSGWAQYLQFCGSMLITVALVAIVANPQHAFDVTIDRGKALPALGGILMMCVVVTGMVMMHRVEPRGHDCPTEFCT